MSTERQESIKSAHLELRFQSASIVEGADETRLVFPAIAFVKRDTPLDENLNTDPDGPRIVSVDVHASVLDELRRGHYGHSGVERLSVFLPPEEFAKWIAAIENIGRDAIRVVADVDDDGEITRLSMNDEPVVIPLGSGTVRTTDAPPRTGTD